MLLPEKHLNISESILGLGAIILELLNRPKKVEALWNEYQYKYANDREFKAYHTFDNFLLALCFLYSVDAVAMSESGGIYKCN